LAKENPKESDKEKVVFFGIIKDGFLKPKLFLGDIKGMQMKLT